MTAPKPTDDDKIQEMMEVSNLELPTAENVNSSVNGILYSQNDSTNAKAIAICVQSY